MIITAINFMNSNELRLYMGIIVPNCTSILLLFFIACIHTQVQGLPITSLWLIFTGITCMAGIISAWFWRPLSFSRNDYLKYYTLNLLILIFWGVLLFV